MIPWDGSSPTRGKPKRSPTRVIRHGDTDETAKHIKDHIQNRRKSTVAIDLEEFDTAREDGSGSPDEQKVLFGSSTDRGSEQITERNEEQRVRNDIHSNVD